MSPLGMIIVGFLLALTGAVLPLLMVIHVVPSTFFLNFFSYGASVVGIVLGVTELLTTFGKVKIKLIAYL